MLFKVFSKLALVLCFVSVQALAYQIPLNDARSVRTKQQIGTVFMSQPTIADYKVINERQIVVFGSSIGQTRLMIYDVDGRLIISRLVDVTQPLNHVRAEVNKRYPELNIEIAPMGAKVAVNGVVFTEKERDGLYALVANMLGLEKAERWGSTVNMEFPEPMTGDPEAEFYRNYTYEGIIEGLELNSPFQVNVRTTIATVGSEFSETIGVDWTSGGAPGVFTFPNMTASDLSATITALSNDNLAEVLAEPNITVLSGEEASFLVGGEIPMITNDTNGTTITFKEYGIGLDIAAKVKNENEIRLKVQPSVSVVDQILSTTSAEVPQLSTRRATTTIEIADGQTFMIGGLMNSEDIESLQKIPLLGDIPFFGALFSKSVTNRKTSEVVIIATVNLVKPTQADSLTIPRIHKTNTFARWLGMSREFSERNQQDAELVQLMDNGGFAQ
ncbi:general secretion pathway protein GspD [Vibrio inusitatus NBRC 102082]|uniref:General secretion pathway protein GspD n=1 Tax=Vibrio inusitatus NBRC 102082 TaxID=1219070 RepID=A0A4Y3HRC7_9VIBR|nr:pilus assembly protein N-terminal domain-containing protein [Vibrio inusitatus]GEA49587.1 general secretion pathway protein GspD [Vibrio inusitatus NBRC 102082]